MRDISLIGVLWTTALLVATFEVLGQQDWTVCANGCKCKWVSGRKTAECLRAGLSSIPDSLSPEIQFVDLSENSFRNLTSEVFRSVGLIHTQKIFLRDCGIQNVDRDAFKGLLILIELDLSGNKIHTLHPGTFSENIRLRLLAMSRNRLKRLEDGLFTNLTFLQTVDVSNNRINHIGNKTFTNVSNLQTLNLDGNALTHMELTVVEKLIKLASLALHNNPWRCDCHLRPFRDWVMDHNLFNLPTSCAEPQNLERKLWTEVDPDAFACKPQIIWPEPNHVVHADTNDVTLSCRVSGNPPPEVHWVYNSRIITNNTRTKYGDLRYAITITGDVTRWVNLTVSSVRPQDRGEFTCVAKSSGGVDERNISLVIEPTTSGYIGGSSVTNSWALIIGLITGLLALIIIITVLCYCFCRKREVTPGKKSPVNGLSPNGETTHHIGTFQDQEKSLLTVNPVQKPPRRYEASNTSGTEMSELNRKLLDDGSLIALSTAADEDRSYESIDAVSPRGRESHPENEAYPPDLIAFPGRGLNNASPASSSASTAIESLNRLPPLHSYISASPLHSPIYNGFGTLPYSRSQSPFSPPAPVVLPRQGYVTIPRRPRIPSWSSAPTPSLLEDPLASPKAEPVYDNLGPRTTADGSSVLSLNKAGVDQNPRRRSSLSSYNPMEDKELPTLKKLAPLPSTEDRLFWNNGLPVIDCPKRIPYEISTVGPSHLRPKVAPKPPPKPKKSNGPLYEDEGEDGTEV